MREAIHRRASPHPIWKVIGASATGTAHLRGGTSCQDYHEYRELQSGGIVIAIADGAGSARYSADGAHEAVTSALGFLSDETIALESLTTCEQVLDILSQAISHARDRLMSLVSARTQGSRHARLIDFATTLLIALLLPEMVVTAQIGDGAIVKRRSDGALQASPAEESRFANESAFLTSSDYQAHVRLECAPSNEIIGVALLTDGLQALAMQPTKGPPFDGFFEPLFAFVSEPDASVSDLLDFLESERVNARTDDDKTLVLAVRE